MRVSCLVYSPGLTMEDTCSSDTSVDFEQTTRRYIPEDRTPLTTVVRTSNPTFFASYTQIYLYDIWRSVTCSNKTVSLKTKESIIMQKIVYIYISNMWFDELQILLNFMIYFIHTLRRAEKPLRFLLGPKGRTWYNARVLSFCVETSMVTR
jgi:hypothetical protein